jgi:flagellar biosynthesis/type III secretory pathway chaperone
MQVDEKTALLADILDGVKSLFAEMHALALALSHLLEKEEIPAPQLGQSLEQRALLMSRIDGLNNEVAALTEELAAGLNLERPSLPALIRSLPEGQGARIETIAGEIGVIMETIRELDRQNVQAVEKASGKVKEQLKDIALGRKARQAYALFNNAVFFVDKRR